MIGKELLLNQVVLVISSAVISILLTVFSNAELVGANTVNGPSP